MLKQFQRYFCISKYISIWSQHAFSFPAWPGSLESRGEVVGACFSMGSHLSILFVFSSEKSVVPGGFPPHMAVRLPKWSQVSFCLTVHWFQGSAQRSNSLSPAGDGGVSCWWALRLVDPREQHRLFPSRSMNVRSRACTPVQSRLFPRACLEPRLSIWDAAKLCVTDADRIPHSTPRSGLSWDTSVFFKKLVSSRRLEFQRLSKALMAVRFGQPKTRRPTGMGKYMCRHCQLSVSALTHSDCHFGQVIPLSSSFCLSYKHWCMASG